MPKKATSTARFRQITQVLQDQIDDGTLAPHAALPSERSIAENHGVSRMTARRALMAMETEGLAYSEARKGRFVSPKRLTYDISNLASFAPSVRAQGVDLDVRVIAKGTLPATAELAQELGVRKGELLYEYTRLFCARRHATFFETNYVIARQFPGLLEHDLRQPPSLILEHHYNTCADTGDIVMRLRALSSQEADLLGLSPSHPGLELKQIICDGAGKPFCLGRQIWRGELAEFTAQTIINRAPPP